MSSAHLDEVRDVHPIFRANPILIEEGLRLVQGEKHPVDDELKRIDLLFRDKSDIPTFVEVKWSDVAESQMQEYRRLVDRGSPGARLLWLVPTDLAHKAEVASKYAVTVVRYERSKIVRLKELRDSALLHLRTIRGDLSKPYEVRMRGDPITFDSPIAACYFEGAVQTDKGKRKVGLKQQGIGRMLDLIKCLATGHLAEQHPEKSALLAWEAFRAPYVSLAQHESGKYPSVANGGFIEVIRGRQDRTVEKLTMAVWSELDKFHSCAAVQVRDEYGPAAATDLLVRVLFEFAADQKQLTFRIDGLIEHLIDMFEIRPTVPPARVRHSTLNQWVDNIVSAQGYENDMAKRLAELATLKRVLTPRMGTVDMQILTPRRTGERYEAVRRPCQMLSLNRDESLFLPIDVYVSQ